MDSKMCTMGETLQRLWHYAQGRNLRGYPSRFNLALYNRLIEIRAGGRTDI